MEATKVGKAPMAWNRENKSQGKTNVIKSPSDTTLYTPALKRQLRPHALDQDAISKDGATKANPQLDVFNHTFGNEGSSGHARTEPYTVGENF